MEPVASGTVCRRFRTGLSSASVRHVMAELEELGYIRQPHTSAGRVPTERGYRHYVNAIMEPERLSPQEQARVNAQLVVAEHDLESLMEATAALLAEATRLMGLVLFPRPVHDTIRHLEVVNLSPSRVMLVWLLNSGLLKNVVISIEEPLDSSLAQRITNFLNDQLIGAPLEGLSDLLTRRLISEEGSLFVVMQQAMELLQRGLRQVIDDRIAYDGASWMLAQPEFRDPTSVSPLLQALEDRRAFLSVLEEAVVAHDVAVRIGHEISLEPMQSCSLVTAAYTVNGQPVGAVAVLGPTRMSYPRVVAMAQKVAEVVSRVLTEAAGREAR